MFRDVYICDGNSTDGTQEIAKKYGARIMKQKDTDEPNQRLTSFGEARTTCVNQAQESWYFRLDSDEELSAEAESEIREIIARDPQQRVWRIPRKYLVHGKVVDQAITYPNYEIRLFDRQAIFGYTKATHERVQVRPGVSIGTMKACMYIPLPDTYEAFWQKFESGLRFDAIHHKDIGVYSWLYGTVHVVWSLFGYSVKVIRCQMSSGAKMPLKYEWARYRYQGKVWLLITRQFLNNLGSFLRA